MATGTTAVVVRCVCAGGGGVPTSPLKGDGCLGAGDLAADGTRHPVTDNLS